jgi:hypothetical protein
MTIDPVQYARRSATLGVLSLSIVIPASTPPSVEELVTNAYDALATLDCQ